MKTKEELEIESLKKDLKEALDCILDLRRGIDSISKEIIDLKVSLKKNVTNMFDENIETCQTCKAKSILNENLILEISSIEENNKHYKQMFEMKLTEVSVLHRTTEDANALYGAVFNYLEHAHGERNAKEHHLDYKKWLRNE